MVGQGALTASIEVQLLFPEPRNEKRIIMKRQVTPKMSEGTKTYHLPFDRSTGISPEVTLAVRRSGDVDGNIFMLGMAVCSRQENFEKREGRWRAFERLRFRPLIGTPDQLMDNVAVILDRIAVHHPYTTRAVTDEDVMEALGKLKEAFGDEAK